MHCVAHQDFLWADPRSDSVLTLVFARFVAGIALVLLVLVSEQTALALFVLAKAA